MANPELRCSVQTHERGVDPTGTAPGCDAYVLVEVPLPWPASITDHPLLAGVTAAVAASGVAATVLGIVPDHDRADRHRVVVHRRPPGPFRRFRRVERVVPTADLGRATTDLLDEGSRVDRGEGTGGGDDGDGDEVTDLLICTHGRRDRCCGSFGTNLFTAVGVRHARAGVRSWRVSHTGGHRFAPTAVLLPAGTLWAWLDGDLVDTIVHRRGDVADVLGHYRGSSAIGGPAAQVVEREAFRREGWAWLDGHREAHVRRDDGDQVEVGLAVVRRDGTSATYVGTVERRGTVPQPVCGELLTGTGNGKSDSIWVLTRFDAVDPPGVT